MTIAYTPAGPGETPSAALVASLAVPAQNAAANIDAVDVIGNKTDTVAGTSIVAIAKQAVAAPATALTAALAVSAQNVADNVDAVDVIGNKTDTVAGTSIVAIAKQAVAAPATALTAALAVPAQNAADNVDCVDVIGNKTDDESGDSAMAKLYVLGHHIHGVSGVSPSLAAAIPVEATTGVGHWTLGAFSNDIIAANQIASPFDIHFIVIESMNTTTTYELVLYYGAGDTEAGRMRFVREAATTRSVSEPFMTPMIPANSRVRAKVATPDDNGEIITISVRYHTY